MSQIVTTGQEAPGRAPQVADANPALAKLVGLDEFRIHGRGDDDEVIAEALPVVSVVTDRPKDARFEPADGMLGREQIVVLVTLEPGRTLMDLVRLEAKLELLLGRQVDVATVNGLREPVRSAALREAMHV